MGVAVQVQAEVADVVGRIVRLHLGAQHHLVDDLGVRAAAGLRQQGVEALGGGGLALGPLHADGGEEVRQREQLLLARRVVHAIEQGGLLLFQGFGRADIGLDHHLFDQLVRRQGLALLDRHHLALGVEADAALLGFDLQRRAGLAADLHGGVGGPQRAQDRLQQRAGLVVGLAVDGRLGLFVGQLGGRAHQAAHEPVVDLLAAAVELHAHRQAGAVLVLH